MRSHMIGWAMQRFEPTSTITSDCLEVGVGVGRRVEPERLLVGDDGASPCTGGCCRRRGCMPMPNLASAPSSAISSVGIWPVERNATDSGPCSAWIGPDAVAEHVERRRPSRPGAAARSRRAAAGAWPGRARSGVSASQPLGQAMPRFTGWSSVGREADGPPSRRWMSSPQPVEQKPHTMRVVAVGHPVRRHLAEAEAAGQRRARSSASRTRRHRGDPGHAGRDRWRGRTGGARGTRRRR